MAEQLSLPVQLPDDETFESYVSGDNAQVIEYLQSLTEPEKHNDSQFLTFISGEQGSGKSHLLYSICHKAQMQSLSHIYIGLKQYKELSEQLLIGLENIQIVCLDDVHLILEDDDWQLALFDLINRVREVGNCHLVVCANAGPKALSVSLPDLKSRLTWGVSFQIQPLSDEQRVEALINRADRRGLTMSDEVARFLLNHLQRDMPSLMAILDELDDSSLKEKRKLTIPFIKTVLSI